MPATTQSPTKVVTGKVRFSYAHVFVPNAMDEESQKKYSVNIIIPKSDKATIKKLKDAIEAAKAEGLNTKLGGKWPANGKIPLRDGDVEKADDPNYANSYFINASSLTKPGVVDADLNPIMDSTEFYSGCYGRASINFYAFNKAGNKGIAAGLNHVQKLENGEALGGRGSAEEDFGDDSDLLG